MLPAWCAPVAAPASRIYGSIVAMRNAAWDRGVGVSRASLPVISIGNLTVGGTGKSPMVRWIASWAIAKGVVPLIALRGYRSSRAGSDEALEHEALISGARVAVGAKRVRTVRRAIEIDPTIGCVVLDDGFQHRSLARDLDLVLVDGTRSHLDGSLLPLGWLREPPENLRRADGVIVTRSRGYCRELDQLIQRLHGRPALAWCDHMWSGLSVYCIVGDAPLTSQELPCTWLRGVRVAVWAGVAQPQAFVAQLKSQQADIVEVASLRDHAEYGAARIRELARAARAVGATAIATTGKDWVKIAHHAAQVGLPVVVPRLGIAFHQGEAALVERLKSVVGKLPSKE